MKKILSITDSYNWATYFRADNLKRSLRQYSFDIVSFRDINKVDLNSFDIVYVTNWPIYGYIRHKISRKRKYKLVTGVSSHIGRKSASDMRGFFSIFDAIGLSNRFLVDEFSKGNFKKIVYTPFGVDRNTFYSKTDPEDFRGVYGWVGNNSRPVKRFDHIKKAFKDLGSDYTLKVVDNTAGYTREQMANFYNSIGTLICFSESEGTPNPVLEAAMCGRPIISSNVGNVPELMLNIKSFSPADNAQKLVGEIRRYNSPATDLNSIGREVGEAAASDWTWKRRSRDFVKLFE
jgi:glycosyltransferase involved in cell wall biosynthesis